MHCFMIVAMFIVVYTVVCTALWS